MVSYQHINSVQDKLDPATNPLNSRDCYACAITLLDITGYRGLANDIISGLCICPPSKTAYPGIYLRREEGKREPTIGPLLDDISFARQLAHDNPFRRFSAREALTEATRLLDKRRVPKV